jgi:hypothetical protein
MLCLTVHTCQWYSKDNSMSNINIKSERCHTLIYNAMQKRCYLRARITRGKNTDAHSWYLILIVSLVISSVWYINMFYGNTKTEKLLNDLSVIMICLAKLSQEGHEQVVILLFWCSIKHLHETLRMLWGTWWRSGWGTALQTGRLRDRFPMVSMEIFIDIILLVALWPWGRLSLQQKWVPGIFPGGEGGQCVGLTPLPIVIKSGSLNLLEPSGPVKACNRIACFTFTAYVVLLLVSQICRKSIVLQHSLFMCNWKWNEAEQCIVEFRLRWCLCVGLRC